MDDAQDARPDTPVRSETPTSPAAPTARRWSVRTLAATAITAVALSGAGGAALASVSDGGSAESRPGRFGGPPPGVNRQLPNAFQQRPAVPGQPPAATDPASRSTT